MLNDEPMMKQRFFRKRTKNQSNIQKYFGKKSVEKIRIVENSAPLLKQLNRESKIKKKTMKKQISTQDIISKWVITTNKKHPVLSRKSEECCPNNNGYLFSFVHKQMKIDHR